MLGSDAVQKQVDSYTTDIDNWNTRLSKIQDRLLNQFYTLESTVSSIRNNLSAISQIQYIPPVYSSTSSNSN
jgi:flagellar capping protein FliD